MRRVALGIGIAFAKVREQQRVWLGQRCERFAPSNAQMIEHLKNQVSLIDSERLALAYQCEAQRQEIERLTALVARMVVP